MPIKSEDLCGLGVLGDLVFPGKSAGSIREARRATGRLPQPDRGDRGLAGGGGSDREGPEDCKIRV